jgi:phosphoserine phosphatase
LRRLAELKVSTMTLMSRRAADTIAAIEAGPKGPDTGAFFDFDGTLIDGYSATAYFTDRFRRRQMGLREAAAIARVVWHGDMDESEFADPIAEELGIAHLLCTRVTVA